jgi:hypothetical protein
MKPQQIYIYIIIICIIIILGVDTFRIPSSTEGFVDFNTYVRDTLKRIFNWLTGEYVLMPLILNLIIVGPLVFAIGKIYNSTTAYVAGASS